MDFDISFNIFGYCARDISSRYARDAVEFDSVHGESHVKSKHQVFQFVYILGQNFVPSKSIENTLACRLKRQPCL